MGRVIFACDTSTMVCSVALNVDGALYTERAHSGGDHVKTLMPAIRRLFAGVRLSIDNVDLCVCSRGPGSFVGLRISLNTVKGFYAARGIPFVTIPTHDIYGHAYAAADAPLIAAIRATKTAFYIAVYRRGKQIATIEQMDGAALKRTVAALTAQYRVAPLIASIDTSLLEHIAVDVGGGAESVVLPSSAAILCELGDDVYRTEGMAALDSNPDYVRIIDAHKQSMYPQK